jgi:hypothetical protein
MQSWRETSGIVVAELLERDDDDYGDVRQPERNDDAGGHDELTPVLPLA